MHNTILKKSLDWLNHLVAYNTTSSNSNLELIDAIRLEMHKYQIDSRVIFNQDKTKANLFATMNSAGGDIQGGVVFSGHTDVVPVAGQNWDTDPFALTIKGDKIFGRGVADMKGFIAVVMALLPEFKKMKLPFPIHYAFSYDEEVGCRGIASLINVIKQLNIQPRLCIVGEPTSMNLVVAHKGIQTYRCIVKGLAKHSSLTSCGCNAIDYAAKIVCFIRDCARRLSDFGLCDANYDIPFSTISTDIINGGIAHNVIPDNCEFIFETRNLPDINPVAIIEEIENYINKLQAEMRLEYINATIRLEKVSSSPSFNSTLNLTNNFFAKAKSAGKKIIKVAYATEAGYFEDIGIKTIICGPGDIAQAHQANEFIAIKQLAECVDFLSDVDMYF